MSLTRLAASSRRFRILRQEAELGIVGWRDLALIRRRSQGRRILEDVSISLVN